MEMIAFWDIVLCILIVVDHNETTRCNISEGCHIKYSSFELHIWFYEEAVKTGSFATPELKNKIIHKLNSCLVFGMN
jgi:hypothetical protein